jgi:hypothetical protein
MPKVDLNIDVVGPNATVTWDDDAKTLTITNPDTQERWAGSLDELHGQGLIEIADDPTQDELEALLSEPLIVGGMLADLAGATARQQLGAITRAGMRIIWR